MFKFNKKFLLLGGALGAGCGSFLLIFAIAGGIMLSQLTNPKSAPGQTNTNTSPLSSTPSDKKIKIVEIAESYLGTKYVWGCINPSNCGGFDCSGLVVYLYNEVDCHSNLPHNANTLYKISTKISKDELQPGDLVFANWGIRWDGVEGWRHVGIYAGGGKVIHASSSRGEVVEDNISGWWKAYGRIDCQ